MAAVAAELPRAYRQMCDGVPMQASMPARWAPRGGDRHRGWDRARVRFIAKGGIGRAEQLARRSLLRVGVSTVAMRYRLATALDAGPAATQQFLQRAASNPRRAAGASAHEHGSDGRRQCLGAQGHGSGHVGPAGTRRDQSASALRRSRPCGSCPCRGASPLGQSAGRAVWPIGAIRISARPPART